MSESGIESVTLAAGGESVTVSHEEFLTLPDRIKEMKSMGEVHQIPLFEGIQPDVSEVKISGKTGGKHRTYRIGRTVNLVVKGVVTGVNHERKGPDGVLVRTHKVELLAAVPIPAADADKFFTGVIASGKDEAPQEQAG